MRLAVSSLVSLLIAVGPRPSVGQVTASSLETGEHVRYRLLNRSSGTHRFEEGSFQALSASNLTVFDNRSKQTLDVSLDAIRSLDVARGTRDLRWIGGALLGATGCALLGSYLGSQGDKDAGAAVLGCMVGFPVGAIAGFFLGRAIEGPRWIDVELGSIGAAATVGFSVRLPFLQPLREPNTRLEQTR